MLSYSIRVSVSTVIAMVILCFMGSCEDIIEIEVDDASPKTVIEAVISHGGPSFVYLTQSRALSENSRGLPIDKPASVRVVRGDGVVIPFIQMSQAGMYATQDIQNILPEYEYTLQVVIGDEAYTATDYLHPYIEVDSTGLGVRRVFDDDIHYASLRFQDPAGIQNYYRYDVSINGGDFKFVSALNDRFNDGLQVVHEILSPEENLSPGDMMRVRRSIISRSVYRFWNDLQSVNPGSVAPANPRSNISNGALGYFSACSSQTYDFTILNNLPPEEEPDNED